MLLRRKGLQRVTGNENVLVRKIKVQVSERRWRLMCLLNYLKFKKIYIAMLMRRSFSNLFHSKILRFNPKLNRRVRLNVIHVYRNKEINQNEAIQNKAIQNEAIYFGLLSIYTYFSPKTTVHQTKASHCNSAMQRKVLS